MIHVEMPVHPAEVRRCSAPCGIRLQQISDKQILWQHRQPDLRHPSLPQQAHYSRTIRLRPLTPGPSGSKTSRIALLINSLRCPINPATTPSFLYRLLIGNACLARTFLVLVQPYLLTISMVLCHLFMPLLGRGDKESFGDLHVVMAPWLIACGWVFLGMFGSYGLGALF